MTANEKQSVSVQFPLTLGAFRFTISFAFLLLLQIFSVAQINCYNNNNNNNVFITAQPRIC